jgi:hypothetical protein
MIKNTQKEIAKKHCISEAMVSRLLSYDKTTDRHELARDLSKFCGKPAITFIHPRHREVFKKAYPRIFNRA